MDRIWIGGNIGILFDSPEESAQKQKNDTMKYSLIYEYNLDEVVQSIKDQIIPSELEKYWKRPKQKR